MITIEKLKKDMFFEAIPKIKELCLLHGINDICVIPPIISSNTLYFMVITSNNCSIKDFFKFSNLIKKKFEKNFDLHIYEESALLEAIEEKSAFSKKYQNALKSAILLDKLDKKLPLDFQWEQQAQSKKEHHKKRSIESSISKPNFKTYLPLLKRQKLIHSDPSTSHNSTLTNYPIRSQKRVKVSIM